jgi:acyl dehydratase
MNNMKHLGRLSCALYFEDCTLGTQWTSAGRTILESDLATFVNFAWFHEDLFTNQDRRPVAAIQGRPVPLAMIFAMSEGLILPSIDGTGLAFLNVEVDVKAPTQVGDTIYVHCEVIESKLTSKGDRGLVRTQNTVKNAAGDTVLIYRPLRLMKLRANTKA